TNAIYYVFGSWAIFAECFYFFYSGKLVSLMESQKILKFKKNDINLLVFAGGTKFYWLENLIWVHHSFAVEEEKNLFLRDSMLLEADNRDLSFIAENIASVVSPLCIYTPDLKPSAERQKQRRLFEIG